MLNDCSCGDNGGTGSRKRLIGINSGDFLLLTNAMGMSIVQRSAARIKEVKSWLETTVERLTVEPSSHCQS